MNKNSSAEPDGGRANPIDLAMYDGHQQVGAFVPIGHLALIVVERLSLAIAKVAA